MGDVEADRRGIAGCCHEGDVLPDEAILALQQQKLEGEATNDLASPERSLSLEEAQVLAGVVAVGGALS